MDHSPQALIHTPRGYGFVVAHENDSVLVSSALQASESWWSENDVRIVPDHEARSVGLIR